MEAPTYSLYRQCPHFRSVWGFDEAARWFEDLAYARSFRPFIAVAPRSDIDQLASGDTVEHDTVVPAGTLLWALAASSGAAAGFRFEIWNEGCLVVPRLNARNLAGLPATTGPVQAAVPYFVTPPYAVQGSGLLHTRITNLATTTNGVQLAMYLAIPSGWGPTWGRPGSGS